jgi:hypothetical protein
MPRQAYGAHRRVSQAMKARNVGESILRRERDGQGWSWPAYGLTPGSDQQVRVQAWLEAHRGAQEVPRG